MPAGAALQRMPLPISNLQTSNRAPAPANPTALDTAEIAQGEAVGARQLECGHATRTQNNCGPHAHCTQDVMLTNGPWLQPPLTTCGRRQCSWCWGWGFARGWCGCMCRALGLQQATCGRGESSRRRCRGLAWRRCGRMRRALGLQQATRGCGESARGRCWGLAWGGCWCVCRALGLQQTCRRAAWSRQTCRSTAAASKMCL